MGKRKWWLLAAILWMVVIFIFTQLPLSTGENTSGAIEEIVKTEHVSGVGHSGIETINLMVRKSTHVLTFGFLAFLFWKSFELYRFSYIIAWVLTVLYAMTDEYHQSFMPGRVSSLKDVFIYDSTGAFLVLLITFLMKRKNRLKEKKLRGE
ncbi:VanZ family protein [Neobacillus cucumis]|uniref:VanZ family protein n=1 Tax=Neobacillus cucumis TaxID=1740721 RepID=UPI0028530A0B|nr:VanZ family protein [Neobacillus cucumis]MDR4949759.1 VanZ family protein [Neobacillus cucumis]